MIRLTSEQWASNEEEAPLNSVSLPIVLPPQWEDGAVHTHTDTHTHTHTHTLTHISYL